MGLTHKSRILRVLAREPVDYVPSNLEFSGPFAVRVAGELRIPVTELPKYFDNHIVYAYLSDQTRKNELLVDDWGVGIQNQEGAAIVGHPLASRDAFVRYRFPDPNASGLLAGIEQAVSDAGREYFVAGYQKWLLFERACWLRGMENFLLDLVADRDFAEDLLDKITDYQVALAQRIAAAGVDCARTGDDWGSQRGMLFSPTLWRELIRPRLNRVWAVYRDAGIPILHHSCGDIQPILPDLAELGLTILHPLQTVMDRAAVKAQCGSELIFYGGIDCQRVIPVGTPEAVREETRDAIRTLGEGGGLIIGLTHTLTSETPLENLWAMWEAVQAERTRGGD